MSDLLICVDAKDFPTEIPHAFYLPQDSPVVLCGSASLLARPRIAVLNSRQSPRFKRSSGWVQQTIRALQQYDPLSTALVSSLEATAWDFLTWAGGRLGFSIILIFPAGTTQNFALARTRAVMDLGLDPSRVLAVRPLRIGAAKTSAEDHRLRDRWVLALSQTLTPVSIRPGGNFSHHLQHDLLPAQNIEQRFKIPFALSPTTKQLLLKKPIQLPEWYRTEDYLIHWTRAAAGPYPGETKAEAFRRLMEEPFEQAEGIETLARILEEKIIRASGYLVRGGHPVVPFTERSPQELPRLISWRSGLRRWSFEPYGIALKKSTLGKLGARPVVYGRVCDYDLLPEPEKPFFQVLGSAAGDWRQEKEWRLLGDVNLNDFSREEIVIIVRTSQEIPVVREKSPGKIIPLEN